MAGNGIVTLEFVADTKKFVAGAEEVSRSSKRVGADLDDVSKATNRANYQSMVAAHGVRELAAASLMLSSRMPAAAQTTALTAMAVGDLGGAFFRIAPAAQNLWSKMGALTKSVTAVGIAVGVTYGAWEVGTAIGNKFNDMLGRGESAANRAADALYREADAAIAAQQHTLELDKLVTSLNYHSQNGKYGPNDAQVQGPVPFDTHGGLLNSTNGGNTYAAAQEHVRRMARLRSSATSSANSAAQDALRAEQQRLQQWQQIADKYNQVGKSIAEALSPKLEAGDTTSLLIYKAPTLLDKLKKQLTDTKHLADDIRKLTRAGLSGDLIGQLVAGGLGSLPAADELLASGKGGVAEANKLSARINRTANSIGATEALREFNRAPKDQRITVDVTGGEGDLKKVIRKWLKTDRSFANDIKLAAS